MWNDGMPRAQWGAVIGASLAAAVFDMMQRRIPNRLTGPVFLGGLVWSLYACGWGGLRDAFAGGVLLALPFVVLFVCAGGGRRCQDDWAVGKCSNS